MKAPQEPKSYRLALIVVFGLILFLEDILLGILGNSRERLVHWIEGGFLVAIAVGTFLIREPSIRRISGFLAVCWLAMAGLQFGQAVGIPKSELRLPFLIGLAIVGILALGYWFVTQRRATNRTTSGV